MKAKRPVRILLAVLAIFGIVLVGVFLMIQNPAIVPEFVDELGVQDFLISRGLAPEGTEISLVIASMWLFLAVGLAGYALSGIGILLGKNWGRILFIIWAMADLVIGVFIWPDFVQWVGGVALAAIMIWALTGKDASAYFGREVSLEDLNPRMRLSNLLGFLGGFFASILAMISIMDTNFEIELLNIVPPDTIIATLMTLLIIIFSFTGFLAGLSPLISTSRDPKETGLILIWCGALGIVASQVLLGTLVPGAFIIFGAGPLMIIAGILRRIEPKQNSMPA